nr:hypothetical protein [Tanacetum cinerariifolium]
EGSKGWITKEHIPEEHSMYMAQQVKVVTTIRALTKLTGLQQNLSDSWISLGIEGKERAQFKLKKLNFIVNFIKLMVEPHEVTNAMQKVETNHVKRKEEGESGQIVKC